MMLNLLFEDVPSMGSKMQTGISAKDFLQIGVEGCKSMMRRGGTTEQKSHWISFVSKRWLNTNEHVAKLLAIYQEVISIGVERTCIKQWH